jgi:hypothetical protein
MGVKESSAKADPVGRAVAEVKRAITRLIELLGHKDDLVSVKAHCALRDLDPPPIGALAEALLTARAPKLRAGAAGVLGAAADSDKMRVLMILGHAYKAEADMAVRMAVVDAMLSMKTYFQELEEAVAARPDSASSAVPGRRNDAAVGPPPRRPFEVS